MVVYVEQNHATIATEEVDELNGVIQRMRNHVDIPPEVDYEMYVTLDNDIDVACTISDKEIAESVKQVHGHADTDDETDEILPVTASDAMESLDKLRQYLLTCKSTPSPSFLEGLVQIELFIENNIVSIVLCNP